MRARIQIHTKITTSHTRSPKPKIGKIEDVHVNQTETNVESRMMPIGAFIVLVSELVRLFA